MPAPLGEHGPVAGLRVRVLGGFDVDGIPAPRLGSRKGRTLLKVLALARGHPVPVDRLVDALWPDTPPARPAEQVAVLVSRLRTAATADIARTDAGYALSIDWLDVDAAAALTDEAERRLESGALAAARSAAGAALALLRGPLLPEDPDAAWAEADRAAAQRLAARHRAHCGEGRPGSRRRRSGRRRAGRPRARHRPIRRGRPAAGDACPGRSRPARVSARGLRPLPAAAGRRPRRRSGAGNHGPAHRAPAGGRGPGAAAAEPAGPPLGGAPPTLAGRDDALAALDAALAAARAGVGTLVSRRGRGGHRQDGPARRLGSQGAGGGRARPSGPLRRTRALAAAAAARRRRGPARRRAPARRGRGLLGPDEQVLGPLLASSTRSASGERLAALTDPGAGQALLFAAAFSLLRRQAVRRPVVLLIDDAHLAGPATLAWLRQVPARLATAPVVTVATQRAEERLPLNAETTIELGPLSRTDAAHIVGEDRVDELYARSGGNPLFLAELGAAAPGALPASIRQAVDERCARAGPAAATLRTAAVIGPQVDLDLLAAVTGVPAAELLDHLEEGVRRRILTEEGATFAFRHALVREAVAATASGSRQAYIHRTAGRALQARLGCRPPCGGPACPARRRPGTGRRRAARRGPARAAPLRPRRGRERARRSDRLARHRGSEAGASAHLLDAGPAGGSRRGRDAPPAPRCEAASPRRGGRLGRPLRPALRRGARPRRPGRPGGDRPGGAGQLPRPGGLVVAGRRSHRDGGATADRRARRSPVRGGRLGPAAVGVAGFPAPQPGPQRRGAAPRPPRRRSGAGHLPLSQRVFGHGRGALARDARARGGSSGCA